MVLALSSQQGGALLRVRAFYQWHQGSWYGAATVRISLAFPIVRRELFSFRLLASFISEIRTDWKE